MFWFKDRDLNSSFFHAMVKKRANSNGIQRLVDGDLIFERTLFLFIKLYMILMILIMSLQISGKI